MRKRLNVLLILALMILTLTGCVVSNESSGHYTIKEGSKISDTHSYNVEENFDDMKLKINVELTKGKVKFELKDPTGKIQWSEIVTSDKGFNETKEFSKTVGDWSLIFESIDNSAEGKYEFKFNKK